MALSFIQDTDTKAPCRHEPEPYLTRIVADNAGPFTYTGTGTYIIHGNDHAVIIDPGPTLPDHVDKICEAVDGLKTEAILVTHTHADHSPAAGPLSRQLSAPVLGCAPAVPAPAGKPMAFDESQDRSYKPDKVLEDGELLTFECGRIRAIATPGHIANHLCFHLLDHNALFTGDHIMGWATSVVIPPEGSMTDYMASLHKARALNASSLWPTHGQPIRDVGPFISGLIEHRKKREASILKEIEGGNGAVMDIVSALYTDTPKALHIAAAHSVYSHIIALMDSGAVKTVQGHEISTFFEPNTLEK